MPADPSLPVVTIGVPVYNGAAFLEEALKSLAAQTYPNIQIIISDNASTDGTADICAQFVRDHPRTRYIRHDVNMGGFANFQYLLDVADGAYFSWFAADDSADPTLIAELVAAMEENPEFSAIGCDVRVVDEHGNPTGLERLNSIRLEASKRRWPSVRKGFFDFHIDNRYMLIYGLFRTRLIKQCSVTSFGRVKYMASCEIPLLAHLACLAPIASIDRPLKIYRQHSASAYHQESKAPPAGREFARFFNISWCLLGVAERVPPASRTALILHLLTTFPIALARVSREELRRLMARLRRRHA